MLNRLHVPLVAVALLLLAPLGSAFAEADIDRINDCGVNSLYTLLRLHSRDVELSALRRTLPRPSKDGLSMAELQSAASVYGLNLRGTRLRREDFPLDRPVIALLGSEDPGHFVVLKPVGITGTMVMILDFPRYPSLVDYHAIDNLEGWDGLALVPIRPWEGALPISIAVSCVVTFLLYVLYARFRGRARLDADDLEVVRGIGIATSVSPPRIN